MHADCAGLVENFPAAHSVQGLDPLTGLYLPASHATHVPPSGPVKPTSQVQFVIVVLPAADDAF